MASVYIRLHDDKLFLSDDQQSPDYQAVRIKVSVLFNFLDNDVAVLFAARSASTFPLLAGHCPSSAQRLLS